MAWYRIEKQQKILKIINHVIKRNVPITIRFAEVKESFRSEITRIERVASGGGAEGTLNLIIEKLVPDEGNMRIQVSSGFDVEFSFNRNLCRCSLTCIGSSDRAPYFGHILGFPEVLKVEEKRKEERFPFEAPELVSVEFTVDKGPRKGKVYELGVFDRSKHGLGILVTEKDFDLFDGVRVGDAMRDIIFYATWARIRVEGIVRHRTKITEGKYKGSYILGIESRDIIESCKARET